MSRWLIRTGAAAVLFLVLAASTARAEFIYGFIGAPAATMSDAMGWDTTGIIFDAKPGEEFIFNKAAEGEPFRIYWTVDDDKDEVETCTVQITAIDSAGKRHPLDSPAGTFKAGRHSKLYDRNSWSIPAGSKEGLYKFEIKATVVTPAARAGSTEIEYAWMYLYKKKKWNIAIMVSGDNSLSGQVYGDLEEMDEEDSNKDANCIVLYDRKKAGDTRVIRIHHNYDFRAEGIYLRNPVTNNSTTEADTGSVATANSFFGWMNSNHPADKWLVIFWDHGDGIHGHAHDDTSGTNLSLQETKGILNTLKAARGKDLEIVAFDTCLMGMVEVGYELRGSAKYLIASQRTEGGRGWYHENVLGTVTKNPTITAENFVKVLVANGKNSSSISTISGTRLQGTNNISNLATAVNQLAAALTAHSTKCPEKVLKSRLNAGVTNGQNSAAEDNTNTYLDLWDFADRLQKNCGAAPAIVNAARNVKTVMGKVLVAEYSPKYPKHNGLSIFYPEHYIRQGATRDPSKYYPSPAQASSAQDPANQIPFYDYHVDVEVLLYSTSGDFAAMPGRPWYNWITTDVVTPKVHGVWMWQKKPDGTNRETYKKPDPDTVRSAHDAKGGKLYIKIQFNEEMKISEIPKVTFGLEEPYETFTFKHVNWISTNAAHNTDTWQGVIDLPADPKRLNGLHSLKIFAADKQGNWLDENWDKKGRQYDPGFYFSIHLNGLPFLRTVSVRQGDEQKGGDLFYLAMWSDEGIHRAFHPDQKHKFVNLGKKARDVRLGLTFSTPVKQTDIRVDIGPLTGLTAVPWSAGSPGPSTLWKVVVPIAQLREKAKKGGVMQITVTAKDVDGNQLDAKPSSYPEYDMASKKWKKYEATRTAAGANKGGPDTWHRLNFIGSSTLVLIDVSGSMDKTKIGNAKASAMKAVEAMKEHSEMAILVFSGCGSSHTRVQQSFTGDKDVLKKKIAAIRTGGSTPLAAATQFAKEYLDANARSSITNFVLLSDGEETCAGDPKAPLGAIGKFKGKKPKPPAKPKTKKPGTGGKTP